MQQFEKMRLGGKTFACVFDFFSDTDMESLAISIIQENTAGDNCTITMSINGYKRMMMSLDAYNVPNAADILEP